MAKKEYLSPEMKEVEISSTAILAGSGCGADVESTTDEGDCLDADAD